MFCSKCGKENPAGAKLCAFCNAEFPTVPAQDNKVNVRISVLGIISFIAGILALLVLFFAVRLIAGILVFVSLGLFGTAFILGISGLIQIGLSAGRLVGRGFAIIGLLIPVIFVLFLFSMIFRPPRAFRMTCGTNLAHIGKAMLTYAGDYDDQFPHAGYKDTVWGSEPVIWDALTREEAFAGKTATISSNLYLLVKYENIMPNSFICKNDRGAKEFNLARYKTANRDLVQVWDFGPQPWKHCSYAYHTPYSQYVLTASSDPGLAVAADRNPWLASPSFKAKDFSRFKFNGDINQKKAGNSPLHQGDGQNVMYMDTHVEFESRSFRGINEDNIYTFWDGSPIQQGVPPVVGSQPKDKFDSLLVHDPPARAKK